MTTVLVAIDVKAARDDTVQRLSRILNAYPGQDEVHVSVLVSGGVREGKSSLLVDANNSDLAKALDAFCDGGASFTIIP